MEINIICVTCSFLIIIASISYQNKHEFFLHIKGFSLVSFMSLIASLIFLIALILNIYQQNIDITYYFVMAGNFIFIIFGGMLSFIDHFYIRYKKRRK